MEDSMYDQINQGRATGKYFQSIFNPFNVVKINKKGLTKEGKLEKGLNKIPLTDPLSNKTQKVEVGLLKYYREIREGEFNKIKGIYSSGKEDDLEKLEQEFEREMSKNGYSFI